MTSYVKILRPSVVFLATFAVLVGALIVGYYQPFQILIGILVASLIAGAGNVTNDYYDYEIDKINKPKRVIPSGKIKRKNAAFFAAILYVLANVLAILFLNTDMILLALFNTFISFVYAWKIKATFLGHFIDSWLAASTFLFGALFVNITATIIFLFSMSYLTNLGREIVKGIEDMKGDKKIGARTLPVILGKIISSWIAILFIIFAIAISPIPYFFNLLSISYLLLVIFADLIFLFSCFILLFNPAKSQKIMKIAMFLAIIAFLVGIY
ncbi:MAG: digeranylgeranylglyceryl phosphate synthase [Candidatus Aenigmarchaeota archaeon]|nr:digeranylgeranylglyceryl phosphate synthase [Candidatus Aenigmarchaeota archaeon]